MFTFGPNTFALTYVNSSNLKLKCLGMSGSSGVFYSEENGELFLEELSAIRVSVESLTSVQAQPSVQEKPSDFKVETNEGLEIEIGNFITCDFEGLYHWFRVDEFINSRTILCSNDECTNAEIDVRKANIIVYGSGMQDMAMAKDDAAFENRDR